MTTAAVPQPLGPDSLTFLRERVPRLMRSVYPIGGVVFDGDRAPATGAEVRDPDV